MEVFTVGELYFRILAEPNPQCGGQRAWRLKELAERASALSGRPHLANNISGHLRNSLRRREEVQSVREAGERDAVWSLTPKARLRKLRAAAAFAQLHSLRHLPPRSRARPRARRRASSVRRRWACCAIRPCRCPASRCRRRRWQMLCRLQGTAQQRCWLPRRRRSARRAGARCARCARSAVRAPRRTLRLLWRRLDQCRRTYFERQCADDTSPLSAFRVPCVMRARPAARSCSLCVWGHLITP